jgi:hypothetical protein
MSILTWNLEVSQGCQIFIPKCSIFIFWEGLGVKKFGKYTIWYIYGEFFLFEAFIFLKYTQ